MLLGAEIVVFLFVTFERDGLKEVDCDGGLRGAAQLEEAPVAEVGEDEARGQDDQNAN